MSLECYPNRMIYRTDQVITTLVVENTASETELRDHLLSMLIIANNKAIDNGIITEGQNLRDIISMSEIARTISLLREKKPGQYEVCLVAINNTYRVDDFKVKFIVKSL